MTRFRYGLSGRSARYWEHAGIAPAPRFQWHNRRYPVITPVKAQYLRRWYERSVIRSRALFGKN